MTIRCSRYSMLVLWFIMYHQNHMNTLKSIANIRFKQVSASSARNFCDKSWDLLKSSFHGQANSEVCGCFFSPIHAPAFGINAKKTGQVQTNGGDLLRKSKSGPGQRKTFLDAFAASKMTSHLALKDWLLIANGGPNLTSPLIFVSLRSYLRDPATLRRNGCLFLELCSFGLGHVSTKKNGWTFPVINNIKIHGSWLVSMWTFPLGP